MAIYYPPVGFHFKVEVLGIPLIDQDARFTDVGGLSVELSAEEVAEGGQNRFIQKFPVRTKYPEMVLKRGLLLKSEVTAAPTWVWVKWCASSPTSSPNRPLSLRNASRAATPTSS